MPSNVLNIGPLHDTTLFSCFLHHYCLQILHVSGDGTATATAAMAAPLFTAEINNSLVINYKCNSIAYRRPAFNYHLLCQFETAARSSFQARWMRVLVKVSVTLTTSSGRFTFQTRVWQEKCCEKKFSNSLV